MAFIFWLVHHDIIDSDIPVQDVRFSDKSLVD